MKPFSWINLYLLVLVTLLYIISADIVDEVNNISGFGDLGSGEAGTSSRRDQNEVFHEHEESRNDLPNLRSFQSFEYPDMKTGENAHLSERLSGMSAANNAFGSGPSQILPAGKRSAQLPKFLHSLFINPYVDWNYGHDTDSLKKLHGFEYCSHLNGAVFDMSVPVEADVLATILSPATDRGQEGNELKDKSGYWSKFKSKFTSSEQMPGHNQPQHWEQSADSEATSSSWHTAQSNFDETDEHSSSFDSRKYDFRAAEVPGSTSRLANGFSEYSSSFKNGDGRYQQKAQSSVNGRKLGRTSSRMFARDFSEFDLVKFVDKMAYLLARDVISRYNLYLLLGPSSKRRAPVSIQSAKKFACFLAADGHNDWVQLVPYGVKRKFMQFIDGHRYFGDGIPAFKPLSMQKVRRDAQELSPTGHYGGPVSQSLFEKLFSSQQQCSSSSKLPAGSVKERSKPFSKVPYEDNFAYNTKSRKNDLVHPHKLAYLLLVHKNYEDVVRLLEAIIDPYVVIVVHVDSKNPTLKEQLMRYVYEQVASGSNIYYERVRIMKTTANGAWGHQSLVLAQMAGFFELLDFDKDWEYVINISGNDYPLRHNDVIYSDLVRNHPNQNLIEYWPDIQSVPRLNFLPLLLNEKGFAGLTLGFTNSHRQTKIQENMQDLMQALNGRNVNIEGIQSEPAEGESDETARAENTNMLTDANFHDYKVKSPRFGRLAYPYPSFKLVKHHQWMILTRQFVEWMRSSPLTMYLLAYNEFTSIPDESFFGILALNTPFRNTLTNNCKRHLYFSVGASHPNTITIKDLPKLKKSVKKNGNIFTRKVELGCSGDLLECLDKYRDQDRAEWFQKTQQHHANLEENYKLGIYSNDDGNMQEPNIEDTNSGPSPGDLDLVSTSDQLDNTDSVIFSKDPEKSPTVRRKGTTRRKMRGFFRKFYPRETGYSNKNSKQADRSGYLELARERTLGNYYK